MLQPYRGVTPEGPWNLSFLSLPLQSGLILRFSKISRDFRADRDFACMAPGSGQVGPRGHWSRSAAGLEPGTVEGVASDRIENPVERCSAEPMGAERAQRTSHLLAAPGSMRQFVDLGCCPLAHRPGAGHHGRLSEVRYARRMISASSFPHRVSWLSRSTRSFRSVLTHRDFPAWRETACEAC